MFENGISYEFIHGVTLTKDNCRSPDLYPIIAAEMAHLHKTIPLTPEPGDAKLKSALWKKIQNFYDLTKDILRSNRTMAKLLGNKYEFTPEVVTVDFEEMRNLMEKEPIPVAFCHNDILLGNVIHNEEERKVSFIDFEYAMPNYVTFDIGNHFNEMVFFALH